MVKLYPSKNRWYKEIRKKLFEILGSSCVKCGFSDIKALQIDHINGGGSQDRIKHGSRIYIYRFYVENPEKAKQELQILCANCNWIKRTENKEDHKSIVVS